MGLTFQYQGKLKSAIFLPELINEVEDISKILGWQSTIFETEYPNNEFVTPLNKKDYGILLSPTSCDKLSLVFDSQGYIYNPILKEIISGHPPGEIKVITIKLNLDDENSEPEISEGNENFDPSQIPYNITVNTKFTEKESYVKIIELLRYLSTKYLENFTLNDESNYWNTRNPEKINEPQNRINDLMNNFHEMITNESITSPNDFIAFIKRLSQEIKNLEEEE